jgi:hypothetical protein
VHADTKRWAPFVVLTGLALGIWALAAVRGYAWQMIWLPAAVAGAAWPQRTRLALHRCLRRLRRNPDLRAKSS